MPHDNKHFDSKAKTTAVSQYKHVTSDKRVNNKLIAQKAHHAYKVCTQKEITTDVMSPVPNANALSSGAQLKYFIESNTSYNVKNLTLRFQVTASTPLNLPQVAKWFDRIELYNRETNQEISRIYSDVLHLWVNRSDKDIVQNYNELVNQSDVYGERYGDAGQENTPAGQKYYYLPLNYSMFEGADLNLHRLHGDIELRLHPNVAVMGAYAGNLQLDELSGILEIEHPDELSKRAHDSLLSRHVVSHSYCDIQQFVEPSQVMNASVRYEFDLDQFDERSAALLVCIKPTGTYGFQCANVGNGTVDIIGVSGESLYGSGRPVNVNYLRDFVVGRKFGNDYFKQTNVLMIPFCDHPHKAFSGVTHGYHDFDGSKKRLQINTPAAGTQAQYDFVFTADTSTLTGNLEFVYDGEVSTSRPVGSTDGLLTTTLNNLLGNYGYQAAYVSDSVTNKHVEFTNLAGQPVRVPPKFTVKFTSSVAGEAITSQGFSAAGVDGWSSGTCVRKS